MRLHAFAAMIVGAPLAIASPLPADDLKPQTLAAFERYVRATEARMADETAGRSPLLWMDRQPESREQQVRQQLQRGDVVVERLETRESGRRIEADDGLIHHWVGTVLLPGVTLDKVIPFVQGYEKYPQHFAPMIQRSVIRSRDGDRFVVSMRTSMTKVITVVLDGDYTIHTGASTRRGYSRAASR